MNVFARLSRTQIIRFVSLCGLILAVIAIAIGLSVSLIRKKKNRTTTSTASQYHNHRFSGLVPSTLVPSAGRITTVTETTDTVVTTAICQFIEQSPIVVQNAGDDGELALISLTDFDGDHRIDLVYIPTNRETIEVYRGYNNGSFTHHEFYSHVQYLSVISLHLIDLNHDHHTDMIYQLEFAQGLEVHYGFGNGSFHSKTSIKIMDSFYPTDIVLGDPNGDTYFDVIADQLEEENAHVFLSTGIVNFTKTATHIIQSMFPPHRLSLADINNDIHLDVICTGNDELFGIALGIGNGTFHKQQTYSIPYTESPINPVIGDLNGDGIADLVFAKVEQPTIIVVLSNSNGTFQEFSTYSDTFESVLDVGLSALQLGHLNDDKNLDMAAVYYGAGYLQIYFGFGNGSFAQPITLLAKRSLSLVGLAFGDFNNDQHLDIVVADENKSQLIVLINDCQ